MRFLADMGLDVRVVEWLRRQGHDAKHLREEGLHRLPNGLIFKKAIAESRIVLAFDLDFGEIAALTAGQPASVILFRLHNTRTSNVIRRLSTVLADAAGALERGAVVVVEEWRHRIRELPIHRAGPQA
jgi:predicted nuclease of predicted toxin-antitoxin system